MQDIIETLNRYVDDRCPTGGFLHAVLSNDLTQACAKADMRNQNQLHKIVSYVYNNLPLICWGSPEKVDKWLNRKEAE
jgi:hypothetical protein